MIKNIHKIVHHECCTYYVEGYQHCVNKDEICASYYVTYLTFDLDLDDAKV